MWGLVSPAGVALQGGGKHHVGPASGLASHPAGGFSPASVPGLVLWLRGDAGTFQDAALATAAALDGDPVGGWYDLSGQANHASQATASKRPLLKLAVQNGKPAVRFDGVDDLLASAALAAWPSSAGTLFAVYRGVTTGISLAPVNAAAYDGTGDYARFSGDGNGYARNFRSARYNAFAAHPDDTLAHLYVQSSGPDYRLYRDGSQVGTTQAAAWEAPSQWVLGVADAGVGAVHSHIDLMEVVAYSAALSDADRIAITNYLKARWGTP